MSDEGLQSDAVRDDKPNTASPSPGTAGQPLTLGGMVTLLTASIGRLLLIELGVAILGAAVVLGLVVSNWFPIINQAISNLPETGRIMHRHLNLATNFSATLAENTFLAVVLDSHQNSFSGTSAELQVVFRPQGFELCSLLGCAAFSYPDNWIIEFNRVELEPRWGAWRACILSLLLAGVVVGLLLMWALLAALYSPLVYVIALFLDRGLNWRSSWRLASLAQMPAALLMILGILLYGSGLINLLQLAIAAGLHLVVGWVFAAVSPFFLEKAAALASDKINPFQAKSGSKRSELSTNPFAASVSVLPIDHPKSTEESPDSEDPQLPSTETDDNRS